MWGVRRRRDAQLGGTAAGPPDTRLVAATQAELEGLPGIGPKSARQLNAAGLARIGQIARTPIDLLGLLVGRLAPQLSVWTSGRSRQ